MNFVVGFEFLVYFFVMRIVCVCVREGEGEGEVEKEYKRLRWDLKVGLS